MGDGAGRYHRGRVVTPLAESLSRLLVAAGIFLDEDDGRCNGARRPAGLVPDDAHSRSAGG